jgi:hypothetical protein
VELAHVRHVEDAAVAADGAVLGDHALVLDGHLPAGEGDEARPGGGVTAMERRAEERLHGADSNDPRKHEAPD